MSIFSLSSEKTQADEFQQLLRDYGNMAYRMAYQLTGGREAEARDLVQEVFVKIWKQWASCRPNSMKSWMYRVLQNLYIDAARHRARHPAVSLEAPNAQSIRWEDALPDPQPALDHALEKDDLRTAVSRALAQLPEEFRTPVILCDMEGLAYEDISRILSCPIGTVRSRIHRGRTQLRRLLNVAQAQEVAI